MTDKELLELAAKAVGIEIQYQPSSHRFLYEKDLPSLEGKYLAYWSPLTDDGDALRLAVKLGLDICIDTPQENEAHSHVIGFAYKTGAETVDAIEYHGNPYEATRRAIVRAAAEIGKALT